MGFLFVQYLRWWRAVDVGTLGLNAADSVSAHLLGFEEVLVGVSEELLNIVASEA